ncbi:methyl-accepting chemotaxis protein, partial [Rhizobium ruizarguesonis]
TRFTVSYQAEELQSTVQSAESAATSTLRTADRLLTGGDFLGTVASGFSKQQTPQDKIAFINEQMPEIIKSQRLIATSVPTKQKNVIDALAATIDGIKTIGQTPNPT